MAKGSKSIAAVVQALPQELYDKIRALTLPFIPSNSIRKIKPGYTTPSCLRVDRLTRKQFAQLYYGNGSIFLISKDHVEKWIATLPAAHSNLLSEVRILGLSVKVDQNTDYMTEWAKAWESLGPITKAKLSIRVVSFSVSSPGKTQWESGEWIDKKIKWARQNLVFDMAAARRAYG